MRGIICLLLVLCCVVSLSGCGHEHNWIKATCTEPEICTICLKTRGTPVGHSWIEATCTEPKTCSRCGATEGEVLGHSWIEATCTEPKTCSRCGATEGTAGHKWIPANFTSPKTCSVCGETQGEPLDTSDETIERIVTRCVKDHVNQLKIGYNNDHYVDTTKTQIVILSITPVTNLNVSLPGWNADGIFQVFSFTADSREGGFHVFVPYDTPEKPVFRIN